MGRLEEERSGHKSVKLVREIGDREIGNKEIKTRTNRTPTKLKQLSHSHKNKKKQSGENKQNQKREKSRREKGSISRCVSAATDRQSGQTESRSVLMDSQARCSFTAGHWTIPASLPLQVH